VHLFYFISCFCIDKIQKNYKFFQKKKKKFRVSFFVPFFGFCFSSWKIRRRQCGRTQFLRSNALPPIPGRSRSCERPSRLCVRARPLDRDAVQLCVRTRSRCVRTHLQNCYILLLRERTCCPALERTSASCINIPEAVRSFFF
jgi:hypothetical protein